MSATDVLRLRVGDASVLLTTADEALAGWLGVTFADMALDAARHIAPGEADHEVAIRTSGSGAELVIDGDLASASLTLANVVDQFVSWCNRIAIESRPHHLNLHAAAIVSPDRRSCVVLPGEPGAGKSTLAAAALGRGWRYLSDEMVSLDADGVAWPYAKPLTFKQGSRALLDDRVDFAPATLGAHQMRWYLRPSTIGGSVAAPQAPTALVFSRFDPDRGTGLEPIATAEAVVDAATNSQDALDEDGQALLLLAQVASRCACARMTQCDLDEAVGLLEALPSAPPPAPPRLLPPPPPVPDVVGPRIVASARAVVLADGVVVHHPVSAALVALDPLAGLIWQLLDGSTTQDALADELAVVFGHPRAAVATDVQALLTLLDEQGLLEGVSSS